MEDKLENKETISLEVKRKNWNDILKEPAVPTAQTQKRQ
tara:strand:- start:440 stop:556 length:117 start_codon:yes stop_codon:yes gene_type:complete